MEYTKHFSDILDKDEQVLWTGKPKFFPFVMKGLIIGILEIGMGIAWIFLQKDFFKSSDNDIPTFTWFFPVIMFATGAWAILSRLLSFGNTFYACSNRRVMIRSGIIETIIKIIDYDEISDMHVTVGVFEKMSNAGTIRFFSGRTQTDSDSNVTTKVYEGWEAIDDPYAVFKKVKQIAVDIKTDYNYPNALRPDTNPGYNTKYEPEK